MLRACLLPSLLATRYWLLPSAIQRYFLGAKDKDTDPLLDAVAMAWTETFTPIVQRDLEKWVGEI